MPKQKLPTNKDRAEFQARVKEILLEHGATPYGGSFLIESPLGPWYFTIFDDWVATHFEDAERASKALKHDSVNPLTGKFNFHYTTTASKQQAEIFGRVVAGILAKKNPARARGMTYVNISSLYRAYKDQGEVMRRFESTSIPHLRRAIEFGCLEAVPGDKGAWRLTAIGREQLAEHERRLPPHLNAGLFGAANENPAMRSKPGLRSAKRNPTGVKPLQHKFDPARLASGVYETSSASEAYPAARFLVEAGRARIISEQFLPGGRVLLTFETGRKRNPDEPEERTVEVKMSRKWLESRTKQYRDWRTAWWREAIQNSIDPGTGAATRVDLRCEPMADGNWLVSCSDNGNGMTREQVEDPDKGFLVFGGSGKTASSSSIGGFGEAKELLVFPWIQYRLLTSDQEYTGRGNQAKAKKAPMRKGVLLEVIMPADVHTTAEDAALVLARSWIPNVTFTINGKTIKTGIPTPNKKLDEVPGQGIVYETPRRRKTAEVIEIEKQAEPDKEPDKREPADILVRKDGLWMFTERLHGSAKHGMIVEVTGPSTKIFTANRDGFESGAWDLREAIDKAKEEMASEGEVRSKLEKPEELTIRGPMFNAAERALTVRETVGPLQETKAGKPLHLDDSTINQIVQAVASFTAQDLANLPHDQQGEYDEESEERLMQAVMASPEASKIILQTADLKGQTSFDAAVRQVVWQPAFHYRKDEGLKYRIPSKFKPAGMTPAVLRLLKTWAELCRMALVNIGSDMTYGVGFWFSQQYGAGYLRKDNTNWLLLDPHKSKADRTEIYNPANLEDLKWLWSTAQHEVAHMLVFKKTGYSESDRPASHGSDYAYALSTLNQQLADAWPKVKKLAASIKLRGQIPKRESSRPPRPVKSQEKLVGAQRLANAITAFVSLFHHNAVKWDEATPEGVNRMGSAYGTLMYCLLKGSDAKHWAFKTSGDFIKEAKPYINAIFRFDQVYDSPIWIQVKPAWNQPDKYTVSISFNCWDIPNEICNALKDQIRDAAKIMNEDMPSYPRISSLDVRYEFEDWMKENVAENPCPCKGKAPQARRQDLRERYRYFEAEAQKNAAQGHMVAAKQYKLQASRMLEQARLAGEPWAEPASNPRIPRERISGSRKSKYLLHLASMPNEDLERVRGAYPGYWQGGSPVEDRWVPVDSIEQAQKRVEETITQHELGGGNWAGGEVVDGKTHKPVGRISYNGRFWPAEGTKSNPTPNQSVKVMLPSGNLGVYRMIASPKASPEDIMRYQEHIATHFPGPDGISRWYMLRGPQGTGAASSAEAATFDRLPMFASRNPTDRSDLVLPPARKR